MSCGRAQRNRPPLQRRKDLTSALSPPEEESYAAALWEIQRQVTLSAVAMSFAGIAYETDKRCAPARAEDRAGCEIFR